MGLRGETVGTAFVKIIADGSGLPESIADSLRDDKEAFAAQGERDGDSYAKAFEKATKDSPTWANLMSSINKSIANDDATRNFFNGPAWRNIADEIETEFGPEIGKRLAIGLENEFRQKGSLSGLSDALKRLTPRVVSVVKDIQQAEEKINQEFITSQNKLLADAAKVRKKIGDDDDRLLGVLDRAVLRLRDSFGKSFDEMSTSSDKFRLSLERVNNRVARLDRDSGNRLRRVATRIDKVGDSIGRVFGKGSRNNFFNFIGSAIGGVISFGGTVFRVFDGVFDVFRKFGDFVGDVVLDIRDQMAEGAKFSEAFFTTFTSGAAEGAFTTVATGALNLVAGLAALAAIMGLVAIAAGALVSGLLLLGGIIIALASTIEASLIVAVAALLPLLAPLAGVILGIVAAVHEFKNATGDLKAAMDKVKKSAKGLFDTFKERAFARAPKLANNIAREMKALQPLVVAAGKGFNRFAGELTDAFTSPAFEAFVKTMQHFLPSAMSRLGEIVSNVVGIFAGLFRASVPQANNLLDAVVKLTDNWNKFINSGKGQADIKTFLRQAKQSAKALGDFLGSAAGLLQDLLNSGRDTGDSIFTSMANALDRVRNFLEKNPDALTNFFDDAKTFAHRLGGAIEDVVAAIDKIDTPESRRAINRIVTALGGMLVVAAGIVGAFEGIGGVVASVLKGIVGAITILLSAAFAGISDLLHAAGRAQAALSLGFDQSGNQAADAFDRFASASIADLNRLSVAIDDPVTQLKNIPAVDLDIGPALGKLDLLASTLAIIQAAIRNVNATHISPNAAEHGLGPSSDNQPTDQPNSDNGALNGGRVAAGNNIQINVTTPTKDPTAVAVETVNRLVVLGLG